MKVNRKSGFTLIELLLALMIFSLLVINIAMVSRSGNSAAQADIFRQLLNNEMDTTMDRIRLALMEASADEIYPAVKAPLSESHISYSASLGVTGGVVVMGDPERIRWMTSTTDHGRVLWTQAVGQPNEREIQWSRNVPNLQKEEVNNTLDDNSNDLVDEPGLSFHVEKGEDKELQVFTTLTISKKDENGDFIPAYRRSNITCRN